jgi:hypothetical protein
VARLADPVVLSADSFADAERDHNADAEVVRPVIGEMVIVEYQKQTDKLTPLVGCFI